MYNLSQLFKKKALHLNIEHHGYQEGSVEEQAFSHGKMPIFLF